MRTPLQDSLTRTALVPANGAAPADPDPARQLTALFEAAQRTENQYAAERLTELRELAERAMTLGEDAARRRMAEAARASAPRAPWPQRAASVAAGALLAACAPVVAEASLLLAAASGLAALAAIALPFAKGRTPAPPALPAPPTARLKGVAAAADHALQAMVEPRALPAPRGGDARADDDVLGLLQDALALGRTAKDAAAREVAENAERLARHMGYAPAFDGPPDAFEVMVDPGVPAPVTLRPALIHADPARTVAGVRVEKAAR